VRRARAILGAALAGLAGAAAAEPPGGSGSTPLCVASVELDPARAHPGQPVHWRLRVLAREGVGDLDWEEPPAFPGLRAERLATRAPGGRVERDGEVYEVREDERALFAERAGRVVLPAARLLCRARGPAGELAARVATPEAVLEVLPFPEPGRPPGFGGLVGPLSLRRHVTPESVALGQGVRVAVTLQGAGNLWDAPEPELPPEALAGAEVFRRPAELELERGAQLVVRHRFAFDLVPRREGVLRIPELAWSYYDPAAGRYGEAALPAVEVRVAPAAPASASTPRAREQRASDETDAAPEPAGRLRAVAALTLGAALLAAWAAARGPLRRRHREARREAAGALAEAERAKGDRDAELAALSRALRAALAARGIALDGPPEAAAGARLAPAAREALAVLAALERARFDPSAGSPGPAAVLRVLDALGVRPPGPRS
jgi:hypothetical protein